MEAVIKEIRWLDLAEELGEIFSKDTAEHDREATFVEKNYELLKKYGFLKIIIPEEFGGSGLSYLEVCDILRIIAHHDDSTALALSMHQHLLAANVWKYKKGQGGENVLKKAADNNLVLVSTGARDWLESNGEMKKTEGGFIVNAEKRFASQSSGGDILVTSAPYLDHEEGWQVLHFSVPFKTNGVSILNDWYTMGMRGTGSNTVVLKNVFVPDSSVVLKRTKGKYHPFWSVVLTVAMPLIMSVYIGIAEKASSIAIEQIKKRRPNKEHITIMIGEMYNELTAARVQWNDMINICNNFDFIPTDEGASNILVRKSNVARACINTVGKAIEIVGARSYYSNLGLERLFRDVHAGNYHPLIEKNQQFFTGEFLLRD
jgi:alkylation response protein AidB-like acyl-CoA dehydrogenase